MVENQVEVPISEAEDTGQKGNFNPEQAELGALVFEDRVNKIRTSEFRRIFGERCRRVYITPFIQSDTSKMIQNKKQKCYIQVPCLELSLFKEYCG